MTTCGMHICILSDYGFIFCFIVIYFDNHPDIETWEIAEYNSRKKYIFN